MPVHLDAGLEAVCGSPEGSFSHTIERVDCARCIHKHFEMAIDRLENKNYQLEKMNCSLAKQIDELWVQFGTLLRFVLARTDSCNGLYSDYPTKEGNTLVFNPVYFEPPFEHDSPEKLRIEESLMYEPKGFTFSVEPYEDIFSSILEGNEEGSNYMNPSVEIVTRWNSL